eukprot:354_1
MVFELEADTIGLMAGPIIAAILWTYASSETHIYQEVTSALFCYFYPPTLPTPVKATDLSNGNDAAINQFRSDYRHLGVAVLEMDETFQSLATQYRSICDAWLKGNRFSEKRKFIAESKDELFRELGRRPNIGYILTEHKKEYLKFKDSSSQDTFPNTQMYDAFKQLFPLWNDAAMTCMETVLSETVPKEDEPLTDKGDRDAIRKFGAIHASISLIHYFGKQCEKEEENKLNSEDERLSNRTTEVPLGNHIDTGLMTFVTCSEQFGLQVLDRKTNRYYYPEKVFDPMKHMFVMAGRKMELFTWKNVIEPTWHAVTVPLEKERNSLLYFMEIQKDH